MTPQDSGSVAVEVLLTVEIVKDRILALGRRIRGAKHVAGARMVGCRRATVQGCWFPRHVSDLDKVSLGKFAQYSQFCVYVNVEVLRVLCVSVTTW